jgi:hypothetical protein
MCVALVSNRNEVNVDGRQNEAKPNIDSNLSIVDQAFTGVVHATKYRIIEEKDTDDRQALSDYDNVNHCDEHETNIRSHEDIVSLNLSSTSSMMNNVHCPLTFAGEQVDQQMNSKQLIDDDMRLDQQQSIIHLTMIHNTSELMLQNEYEHYDRHLPTTSMFDYDEHDDRISDQSEDSDDLRLVRFFFCPQLILYRQIEDS